MSKQGNRQPGSLEFWSQFDAMKRICVYPAGAMVFEQGRPALGIYLVQVGTVKISFSSGVGVQVLARAGPGAVLGLSECIAGATHKVSAEAISSTELGFVEGRGFIAHLRDHPGTCIEIVRFLSEDLHALYQEFRFSEGRPRRS